MTPEQWTALAVESIKGAAAVLVALVGVGVPAWRRLGKIKKAAEATHREAITAREQVKNDHGTNLRDDVDAVMRVANENTRAIDDLRRTGAATHNAVGAVALEVRRLSEQLEGRPRRRRRA